MQPRLVLNLWSSCFSILSAGITGVHHHNQIWLALIITKHRITKGRGLGWACQNGRALGSSCGLTIKLLYDFGQDAIFLSHRFSNYKWEDRSSELELNRILGSSQVQKKNSRTITRNLIIFFQCQWE
jgi:hypothetical protein